MKKKNLLLMVLFVLFGMKSSAYVVTDTIFNRYEHEDFAFGADVSFVPMMESWGTKWLDKNGRQKDILQILKEQGINSVRLRVWTVASGASSKQEVVDMCKRAKAKGLSVMIDFHYSDTWADPGNQTIPSAWKDHSVDALAKNIYDHTYDVLSAIKAAGVVPKWVQVGNETKRGMLYPVGQTNKGGSVAFAKFVLNGYNAVKAVDSTMQVIVHLPDGHDNSLYRSIFDGLKKNGAKWDIIGLSAYPRWSHLDGPTMITKVMSNINDLKSRYGKPCMVVETGHYPNKAIEGNQYLVGVMDKMIRNGDLGCFYWEPESMGGYDMGAWDESTKKPTAMMDAYLGVKHTEVGWLMKAQVQSPIQDQTVASTEKLTLQTDVQHVRPDRIQSVAIYYDKKLAGTVKTKPYEVTVTNPATGVHTVWAKATDNAKNTQTTDTVTFFVGEWAQMDDVVVENGTQKGGIAKWAMAMEAGKYRLAFKYSTPTFHGVEVWVNNDSIARINFLKKENAYQIVDIEVPVAGNNEIQLKASNSTGLPEINSLLVFPLDGQSLPQKVDLTGVSVPITSDNEEVGVYSLSGILLFKSTPAQLGISLGDKTSVVVTLPHSQVNCVGGTPNIVRKLRLK